MSRYQFTFESTDLCRLLREISRWLRTVTWPDGEADLKNQAIRAMNSAWLNAGEGWERGGRTGKNQFRIAHASACEVLLVLDIVDVDGAAERQDELRRVGAILAKLRR